MFPARQIDVREFETGTGLRKLRAHGVDFGGTPAFLEIGDLRFGVAHAFFRFTPRRCLVHLLECEQRVAGFDLTAALDLQILQVACERRRDSDIFAFGVALQRIVSFVAAARE